jgi:hypothetical protein
VRLDRLDGFLHEGTAQVAVVIAVGALARRPGRAGGRHSSILRAVVDIVNIAGYCMLTLATLEDA